MGPMSPLPQITVCFYFQSPNHFFLLLFFFFLKKKKKKTPKNKNLCGSSIITPTIRQRERECLESTF